ncbi:MAG TPA: formate dehydrogenase accessory protein FdhE [Candidatus Dormibacteraeota bacterium]
MQELAKVYRPWADRRRRAAELAARYPHAAEVLQLYAALLDVQEGIYDAALAAPTEPEQVAAFAIEQALPRVLDVTVAAGPEKLAATAVARYHSADLGDLVGRWLRLEEQPLVDRYLARAALTPIFEAASPALATAACTGRAGGAACPTCGGPPQVSWSALSGEALVTGPRYLQCARCQAAWGHTRLTCPNCGETQGAQLPVYSESERFPHLAVEGCKTCNTYLIHVDLRRDAAAVPLVDELAAAPLDLFAKEQGMTKLTPNLVGM